MQNINYINSISEVKLDTKSYLITDDNVYKLYSNDILSLALKENIFIIKPGDKSKNINVILEIVRDMLNKGVNKTYNLIGFGGGVVTDISNFISSIYFRGITSVLIPTTILSLDSSIGGKCGINIEEHKNILGTITLPEYTFINTNYFDTLPEYEVYSGYGEIIKTYLLFDDINVLYNLSNSKDILDYCKSNAKKIVDHKLNIISKDLYENHERYLLNIGHTYGHALEKYTDFKISHGNAILIGILFNLYISDYDIGKLLKYVKSLNYNLIKPSEDKLSHIMQYDKKNKDNDITLVVKENDSYILKSFNIEILETKLIEFNKII